MSEFINTIDALGDDAVVDSIIDRTITEFKDDQVTEIGEYAFYGCDKLETVDLPNVITVIDSAFMYCTALKECFLPNAKIIKGSAFSGTSQLETMYLPEVTEIWGYAFAWNLEALKELYCPKCAVFGYQALCHSSIVTLDIHVKTEFAGSALPGVTALILRSTDGVSTVVNVDALGPKISSGAGYIYVPASMIDAYKAATNWSNVADQFRALEDYTVDGTTTGELDETKI